MLFRLNIVKTHVGRFFFSNLCFVSNLFFCLHSQIDNCSAIFPENLLKEEQKIIEFLLSKATVIYEFLKAQKKENYWNNIVRHLMVFTYISLVHLLMNGPRFKILQIKFLDYPEFIISFLAMLGLNRLYIHA